MDALIVENFRCFQKPPPIPLAPLTLLLGENSTGKSSLLAAIRLAWRIGAGPEQLDFNEEPFPLGAFHQIANYRGGRGGRADSFSLGFRLKLKANGTKQANQPSLFGGEQEMQARNAEVVATFADVHSQAHLSHWVASVGEQRLSIERQSGVHAEELKITTGKGDVTLPFQGQGSIPFEALSRPLLLEMVLKGAQGPTGVSAKDISDLFRSLELVRSTLAPGVQAFAPIRTQPRRTYDLAKDLPRPTGDHVPMILAQMYGGKEWEGLRDAIESFGRTAGLFEALSVKRLGPRESGPFQILIKVSGPASNVVDVGYGVSQILPILVEILRAKRGTTFLIQQPEVHLHPRAQAELASLLGRLVRSEQKQFIVETHSDFLLDRVRMDVRSGMIRPDQVSILYFERKGHQISVHPINLDEGGELLNIPQGYRQFFLDEELRFMGADVSAS